MNVSPKISIRSIVQEAVDLQEVSQCLVREQGLRRGLLARASKDLASSYSIFLRLSFISRAKVFPTCIETQCVVFVGNSYLFLISQARPRKSLALTLAIRITSSRFSGRFQSIERIRAVHKSVSSSFQRIQIDQMLIERLASSVAIIQSLLSISLQYYY